MADEANFIVLVPFNGTDGPGGNPLEQDLNIWYQVGFGVCGIPAHDFSAVGRWTNHAVVGRRQET